MSYLELLVSVHYIFLDIFKQYKQLGLLISLPPIRSAGNFGRVCSSSCANDEQLSFKPHKLTLGEFDLHVTYFSSRIFLIAARMSSIGTRFFAFS